MMTGVQSKSEFADNIGLTSWFGDHAFAHLTYQRLLTADLPVMDVMDQRALGEWQSVMEAAAQGEDPPATESLPAWLLEHNRLHEAELAAAAVSLNPDISSGDFSTPDSFYDWMDRHQRLHDAMNAKLGI